MKNTEAIFASYSNTLLQILYEYPVYFIDLKEMSFTT